MPLTGRPMLSTMLSRCAGGMTWSRIACSMRPHRADASSIPGAGLGPDVQLDLVAVDGGKEVAAEEGHQAERQQHGGEEAEHHSGAMGRAPVPAARHSRRAPARNYARNPAGTGRRIPVLRGLPDGRAFGAGSSPASAPVCATGCRNRSWRKPRPRPADGTGSPRRRRRPNIGTNTIQMHSSETVAGTTIWRAPSRIGGLHLLAALQVVVDVLGW